MGHIHAPLIDHIGHNQIGFQITRQFTGISQSSVIMLPFNSIVINKYARYQLPDAVPLYKLVRFAHNWNVGILEYWNHGFWDNGLVGLEN
jgi:hypothetical protein